MTTRDSLQDITLSLSEAELALPIHRRFEAIAAQLPDKLAIQTKAESYTYDQLNRAANRLAHAIVVACGPEPEGICLLTGDTARLVVAMLAAMKAGKCFTPLDHSYPLGRIAFIVTDSGSQAIVVDDQTWSEAQPAVQAGQTILNMSALDQTLSDENLDLPVQADQAFSMLYTSGSTGNPKGIKKSSRQRMINFTRVSDGIEVQTQDRVLIAGSPGFGSVQSKIIRSLLLGASLHPYDLKADGLAGLADWLIDQQISLYASTPTLFRHFGDSLSADIRFPNIRSVSLGGEASLKTDAELFFNHFPHPDAKLRVSYATSEAGSVCVQWVDKDTDIPGNVIPVGYPSAGREVFIWDEQDQDVAPGEIGEIIVRGAGIIRGYWQRDAQSKGRFWEDPDEPGVSYCRTGDLGKFLADGRLQHVGRKDGMVKIRGYRIEITEIEGALTRMAELREAAVKVIDDARGQKRIVAYIVPQRDIALESRNLRQNLAHHLPEFMIPDIFVKLDEMPLNENGKTDRKNLPEPQAGRPEWGPAFAAAQSDTEIKLAAIWQDLLGLTPIGIDDNFFELGGHSLLAAQMTDQVEATLDQRLGMTHLFNAQTIREMSRLLERGDLSSDWSPIVTLQPNGTRPAFFCVHGMTGDVLWFAALARRMDDRPVFGIQSQGLDGVQEPIDDLEAMASLYILEMRVKQPEGPYFIGGASLGGVIVMEIARQLRRTGQQVGAVVIFDTTPPGQRSDPRFALSTFQKLSRFSANFPRWLSQISRKDRQEISRRVNRKLRALGRQMGLLKHRPASSAERLDYADELADYRIRVIEANSRANRGYKLKPYADNTLLFRATSRPLMSFQDPEAGWHVLVKDQLKTVDIQGTHESIFQPPGVDQMAAELKRYLLNKES